MKKWLIGLGVLVVIVLGMSTVMLLVTSNRSTEDNLTISNQENNMTENNQNNGKGLVVYFSRTGENYGVGEISVGNTAMMAKHRR